MKLKTLITFILLFIFRSASGLIINSFIPYDASYVIKIDFGRLNSKSNGMDYLKYIKGMIKDYDNYGYYNPENEYEESCQIINIKNIIEFPQDFGVNMNSQAYVYKKKSQLYSGMTYLFQLSDVQKFQSKIEKIKCLNQSAYVTRQTEHGKIYLSEKYVVGFNKDLAYIFVNDQSKFNIEESAGTGTVSDYYGYRRNYNNTYKDSIYLEEVKAYRIKSDSLFYLNLNKDNEVSYYNLSDEYAKIDESIIARAKERFKLKQEEILRKKLEKLIPDFETILVERTNSISSDRNYKVISKDDNDLLIFINNPALFLGDALNPFSRRYSYYPEEKKSVISTNKIYTNNISSAYTFNFDKGEVKFKTYNTFGNEAFDIIKKAYSKKQSSDLFKYIDASDLMAFASISFNTKEMVSFYEKFYFEYLENSSYYKSEINIPPAIELFWAMIDKDMLFGTCTDRKLFAVNGFIETKISYQSYDYDEDFERKEVTKEKIVKSPRMVLVLGIENKENAKKLFDIISKFSVFRKLKDNVIMMSASRDIQLNLYFVMTEDAFILTNDHVLALEKQNGYSKDKLMSKDLQKYILHHNFAMKIYTNKLFKAINENFPSDSREMRKISSIANNLGDLTFNDLDLGENMYMMEGTLSLTNSTENSLQILLKLFERI